MSGYAILAPAALGGPPGWVIWAVGGTALTVGTIFMAKKVVDRARAPAVPATQTKTCEECKRPYSITVHAQGTDCGGKSSSTKGAPALQSVGVPFPAVAGVALSNATWAVLDKSQKKIRANVKVKLEGWILDLPPNGFRGQKSFEVRGVAGGIRYDTDSYGPTNNYVT